MPRRTADRALPDDLWRTPKPQPKAIVELEVSPPWNKLHSIQHKVVNSGSMGFFDKFFGGSKKDSTFTPSAELMPESTFWNLILTSFNEAAGEIDLQEKELTGLLQKLPLQDVITFQNRYSQLRGLAYTWPLWGAAYIINGGCGDDSFCYFRDWLIVQGQDVYTNALVDPESLVDLELDEDETDAENMAYVAGSVFAERTGEHLPAEFAENYEISGPEWKEEGDDLAKMFPKLWNKYYGDE